MNRNEFSKDEVESYLTAIYRGWHVYRLPWGVDMRIAATKYEFHDNRSPVVYKDFKLLDVLGEHMAMRKVEQMIDKIEAEGFDAYVVRMVAQWESVS